MGRPYNPDKQPRIASLSFVEYRILMQFAEGRPTREVAYALGLSESMIRTYSTRAYRKLKAKSRGEAVAKFVQKLPPSRLPGAKGPEETPLSPAWKTYLREFDTLLFARLEKTIQKARRNMTVCLHAAYVDANVTSPLQLRNNGYREQRKNALKHALDPAYLPNAVRAMPVRIG